MSQEQNNKFGSITLLETKIRQELPSKVKSILLNKINGIEIDYSSNRKLALASFTVLIGGMLIGGTIQGDAGNYIALISLVLFFALAIAFLASRKISLIIHSGNLTITQHISGSGINKAKEFLDEIEKQIEKN